MQRAIPQQKIGVYFNYLTQHRFHYIKLTDNLPSSLARRAGLKDYDRIISFNGVNVESDTHDQLVHRFHTERHLPVQMLACSPATYAHYKENNKLFHNDLPIIQRLKPVYATTTSDFNTDTPAVSISNEIFCAIHWENNSIVSTVPQSAIFKSPEFTNVNDICFIEAEGQYRKGQIIFIGSRRDCEKLKTSSIVSGISIAFSMVTDSFLRKRQNTLDSTANPKLGTTYDKSVPVFDTNTTLSSQQSPQMLETDKIQAQIIIKNANDDTILRQSIDAVQYIQDRTYTKLEELPNELFYYLFSFIDILHLYSAFWGLNSRLNSIFGSCQNLPLNVDDKIDPVLMKFYAPYVNRLIIRTLINYDFNEFHNLHALILCVENSQHLPQIQPNIMPNLMRLSFFLGSNFTPPKQLICDIFSNRFPSLRHVNLGCIDESTCESWTKSPSLQFLSILSCKPMSFLAILASCPNLYHLQVHISYKNNDIVTLFPPFNHPLQRLTLWSDNTELTFNDIDNFLTNTPNIKYLYLQTIYPMQFIDLVHGLANRLYYLSKFDCYVKEMLTINDRSGNLTNIHQIRSCFNRIQCIEEDDKFRIFATV
ncbi:unnamed protein product [Rotaria sp. Silwood1]|nr:unnamed protein product [Rotaria sp. Silwood1]